MLAEGEHKFSKACQFADDYSALHCTVLVLQPIAKAFIRNMNRVRGLGVFPINAVAIATVNEAARCDAIVRNQLSLDDHRLNPESPTFDKALFEKVDKERQSIASAWSKRDQEKNGRMFFKVGKTGLNTVIEWNPLWAPDAVQALMASMLTGLWTAFESLAQDTWVTAVNEQAVPLARRILDPRLQKAEQPKSISWNVFASSGFNLEHSMGTILLRERKVDFQSFGLIRDAYKVAFDGELEPIFDTHGGELFRLETVRNLFVHKGGIVDDKFIKRMGETRSEIREMKGQPLSVSGEYVAMMADVVAGAGTDLVLAVDKWLEENASDDNAQPNDDS